MAILNKVLGAFTSDSADSEIDKMRKRLRRMSNRELLQYEGALGGEIFGPQQKNQRRTFFNLDDKTWVWYDESFDANGRPLKPVTIRYEINDDGNIIKITEGPRLTLLRGQELNNFRRAVQIYYEKISREIYTRDSRTGVKL